MTYYALDYSDVSGSVLLNGPIIAAASANGILIADGLAAWAPVANGGSSCTAGLLLPPFPTTKPGCDVHPTLLGHQLLANAVIDAVADSCPAHSAKGCLDRNQG